MCGGCWIVVSSLTMIFRIVKYYANSTGVLLVSFIL
jgi:hypothetical protein